MFCWVTKGEINSFSPTLGRTMSPLGCWEFLKTRKFTAGKTTMCADGNLLVGAITPPIAEIIWVKNVRAIVICRFLMK